MNELEESIKDILFQIGKDIKVHKLVDGNLILDIDYDKYADQILNICNKHIERSRDVW
jgi:uncharacterized protein (DUF302 family)